MLSDSIITVALIALIATSLTSCRKNNIEEPLVAPEMVVGRWVISTIMDDANQNMIMDDLVMYPTLYVQDEYNIDGTMLRRVGDISDTTKFSGTWNVIYDELTLSLENGFNSVYKLTSVSDSQLVLLNKPNGFTVWTTLVKVQ
jgi:hypothetical protein